MKNKIIIIILFLFLFSFCSRDRFLLMNNSNYRLKINRKLGTYAQKQNLWKEAVYRWSEVVRLSPEDYKAHNNLAIAYEAIGLYDKAEKEYKIALKLSNNDEYIKRNYGNFIAMLKNKNKSKRGKNGKKKL